MEEQEDTNEDDNKNKVTFTYEECYFAGRCPECNNILLCGEMDGYTTHRCSECDFTYNTKQNSMGCN